MLVFWGGRGCGCGGFLLPLALLTLPGMANVLPVTWQSVAAHLCILLIAGRLDLALPPSPIPLFALEQFILQLLNFFGELFSYSGASQHLWILIAFLHKEKEALC